MKVAAFLALVVAYLAFLNACKYNKYAPLDDDSSIPPDPSGNIPVCNNRLRIGGRFNVKDDKLKEAAWDIWAADKNRAVIGQDFDYYLGRRSVNKKPLEIPEPYVPLFTFIDKKLYQKNGTYKALRELLESYVGKEFRHLRQIRTQIFFDEVTKSDPYYVLQNFLAKEDCQVAKNPAEFKRVMSNLWIGRYQMPGAKWTQSYCEHLFIGGVNNDTDPPTVKGLHHWFSIGYFEEVKRLAYAGYIFDMKKLLPNIRFKIGGAWKKDGSVLMAASPECEIALISLAYFTRNNRKAKFFLGGCTPTLIKTEDYDVHGRKFLKGGFLGSFAPRDNEICPIYVE